MAKYVVTNVRLPKEDLIYYRETALSCGKSFSELVREVLAQTMHPVELPKRSGRKYPSFWDIAKIAVPGGPKDGSTKHDRYLY